MTTPRQNGALTGPPRTAGYRPAQQAPLWFGSNWGQFSHAVVDEMLDDAQVGLCLEYRSAPLFRAKLQIACQNGNVQSFIQETLRTFWEAGLEIALEDEAYGHKPTEVCYEEKDGRIKFSHLEPIHPRDARPWELRGQYYGLSLTSLGQSTTSNAEMEEKGQIFLEGPTKDRPAKGAWWVHGEKHDRWNGRTCLKAAWLPWRYKTMPQGALETLFKWVYRHSLGCSVIRHPDEVIPDPNGGPPVHAQTLARQMMELINAGGILTMDSSTDEQGKYKWFIEQWAKIEGNSQGLIDPLEYFDKMIQRGVGIPDEVITHQGNTGGYSRSQVAVAAYYLNAEKRLQAKLHQFDRMILRPLVLLNFGDVPYEIVPAPLLEEQQPPGQGGQQPGQPPQPGAPGAEQGGGDNPLAALLGGGGGPGGGPPGGGNGQPAGPMKFSLAGTAPPASWGQILTRQATHIRIVGPTKSGKTNLAHVIAAHVPGRLLIVDPVWEPGNWGGAPAVTVADDGSYEPIETALTAVLDEMKRRAVEIQQGRRDFERLTIILDEVPDTVSELPDVAGLLIRRLGQRGRHEDIHLVGCGQSDRVAAWGIAGYGDVAESFTTVYLGSKAVEQMPELAGEPFPGVLEWQGVLYPMDLSELASLEDDIPPNKVLTLPGVDMVGGPKGGLAMSWTLAGKGPRGGQIWRNERGQEYHGRNPPGGGYSRTPGQQARQTQTHEAKAAVEQAMLQAAQQAGHAVVGGAQATKAAAGRVGQAAWDAMPPQMQAAAAKAWSLAKAVEHMAMVGFRKTREAAIQTAKARGADDETARRVGRVLAFIDLGLAWTVQAPAVYAATGSLTAAKFSSWIPLGSLGYLAYSMSRNPFLTARAAAQAIAGRAARPQPAGVAMSLARAQIESAAGKLTPRVQRGGDWYVALVLHALDETQGLDAAIVQADQAFKAQPTDPTEEAEGPARMSLDYRAVLSYQALRADVVKWRDLLREEEELDRARYFARGLNEQAQTGRKLSHARLSHIRQELGDSSWTVWRNPRSGKWQAIHVCDWKEQQAHGIRMSGQGWLFDPWGGSEMRRGAEAAAPSQQSSLFGDFGGAAGADPWEPYYGQRGPKKGQQVGWRHRVTGRIEYQKEKPGPGHPTKKEEPPAKQQAKRTRKQQVDAAVDLFRQAHRGGEALEVLAESAAKLPNEQLAQAVTELGREPRPAATRQELLAELGAAVAGAPEEAETDEDRLYFGQDRKINAPPPPPQRSKKAKQSWYDDTATYPPDEGLHALSDEELGAALRAHTKKHGRYLNTYSDEAKLRAAQLWQEHDRRKPGRKAAEAEERKNLLAADTWPDGRTRPKAGDEVYQQARGMFGTAGSISGEVYQDKKGDLRVRVTGAHGFFGESAGGSKTFPLDPSWTLKGDPVVKKRQEEADARRKAKDDEFEQERREMREWEEKYGAKPGTLKPGDVVESRTGYKYVIKQIEQGDKGEGAVGIDQADGSEVWMGLTRGYKKVEEAAAPTPPEAPAPAKEEGAKKEPWQMTAAEWQKDYQDKMRADPTRKSAEPLLADLWRAGERTGTDTVRVVTRKRLEQFLEKHYKELAGGATLRDVETGQFGAGGMYGGDYWLSPRPGNQSFTIVQNADPYQGPNADHRAQIQQAIDQGRTIPEEVLADYPELRGDIKHRDKVDEATGAKLTAPAKVAPAPAAGETAAEFKRRLDSVPEGEVAYVVARRTYDNGKTVWEGYDAKTGEKIVEADRIAGPASVTGKLNKRTGQYRFVGGILGDIPLAGDEQFTNGMIDKAIAENDSQLAEIRARKAAEEPSPAPPKVDPADYGYISEAVEDLGLDPANLTHAEADEVRQHVYKQDGKHYTGGQIFAVAEQMKAKKGEQAPAPASPPPAAQEEPPAKEPWEMTREEFETQHRAKNKVQAGFQIAGKAYPSGPIHDVRRIPPEVFERLGKDISWDDVEHGFVDEKGSFITEEDRPDLARRLHSQLVQEAIDEGRQVPEEVLKRDYPHLLERQRERDEAKAAKEEPKPTEAKEEEKPADGPKKPHEMTAQELQAHYEADPEFAAKWDRQFGPQQPISNGGLGHRMFIEGAVKRGMDVPLHVRKEAGEGVQQWEKTLAERVEEAARHFRSGGVRMFGGGKSSDERLADASRELPPEQLRDIKSGHRRAVEQALAEGKPVSPEVMADYPDLTKKHPASPLEKAPPGGWTEADKVPEADAREEPKPADDKEAKRRELMRQARELGMLPKYQLAGKDEERRQALRDKQNKGLMKPAEDAELLALDLARDMTPDEVQALANKAYAKEKEGEKAGFSPGGSELDKLEGLYDKLGTSDFRRVYTAIPLMKEIAPRPAPGAAPRSPHLRLADDLAAKLKAGEQIDAKALWQAADEAHAGTRAEGKYGPSDAYDSLEAAFNVSLRGETDPTLPLDEAQEQARQIEERVRQLPTQTNRSGNKDAFQQFSTPPHYSYAAAWVAGLSPEDVVLEPSAGTGCLAVHAANAGAEVYANELDDRRADFLRDQFGRDHVYVENAEQIAGILPKRGMKPPSVVIMNPPFSQTAGRMGDKKDLMGGAKHIEEAMRLLQDGGRLVAIVGRGMAPDSPTFRDWFARMGKQYSLRANVGVGGGEYNKYGTRFGTRLLVFDKTGPQAEGQQAVTGDAESIPDLMAMLAGVRDERQHQQASGEPVRGEAAAGAGGGAGHDAAVPAATGGDLFGAGPGRGVPVPAVPAGVAGAGAVPGPRGPGLDDVVAGGRPGDAGVGSEPVAGAGGDDSGRPPVKPAGKPQEGRKPGRGGAGAGGKPVQQPPADVPVLRPAQRLSYTPKAAPEPVKAQGGPAANASLGDSLYEHYEPSRIQIPGAKRHPTPLVESAAMAAVQPPMPTYQPHLSPDVVDKALLSEAGLESVIYAGQAHSQFLPAAEGEAPARRGFMLGDGTGAGKGRQIAGVMVDNWNQGRKRHVWVTEKQTLLEDARRDWKALGHDPAEIYTFDDLRKGKAPAEGILFITYDTLKSAPRTQGEKPNIEAVIDHLGPNFEGCIAFDEAHGMGNAQDDEGERGVKKASKKALAGLDLQRRTPNSRVMYVSATGATDVRNLGYAERLGLWGRGTPFSTKQEFIAEMDRGGVAAMECVAQNLKAMGGYMARTLALDDGTPQGTVTYDRLTHPMSDEQQFMYNALADGWQHVLRNINRALEATGGNKSGMAKANAMGQFWGAQQRFFNQVLTSMQTPSVVQAIEDDLKNDRSAVIQLVNTNESATARAIAQQKESEAPDYESLDVSPRAVLEMYLKTSFPTERYEEYVDDDGNTRSRQVKDANGDAVHDPQAEAIRDELLDVIGSYRIPEAPIDLILKHFGEEQVAECTGRRIKLAQVEKDGKIAVEPVARKPEVANLTEAKAFQDGKKRILIFSDAGGTGRSYHASRKAKNQQKREHYLLQAGWRADKAMQAMGRTHRTNQVFAPHYRLVQVDMAPAQKRFISTIARRLDQLGALTKGQRQTGSTGIFKAADNLESPEARQALEGFFMDLRAGRVEGLSYADVMDQLGLEVKEEEEGGGRRRRGQKPETPGMEKFLNRMLCLKLDMQAKLFGAFEDRLNKSIERAVREGTLDTGVENYPADQITKLHEQTVYKDEGTGAEAKLVTVKVKTEAERRTFAETEQGEKPLYYVRGKQSGKVWAAYKWPDKTDARTGNVTPQVCLRGPGSTQYKEAYAVDPQAYGAQYERLEPAEARREWDRQYAEAPTHKETEETFITGAFLPVWNRIPGERPKIFRLKSDDGQTFVARHIPAKLVETARRNLGAERPEGDGGVKSAADIHARLERGQVVATLANGWKLKPVRVQGERRIELVGPSGFHMRELGQDGVTTERISYTTRFFVPTGAAGQKVLERITKTRPITDEVSLD